MANMACFSFDYPSNPIHDDSGLLHDATYTAGVTFIPEGRNGGGAYCESGGLTVPRVASGDPIYLTQTVMVAAKSVGSDARRRVLAIMPTNDGSGVGFELLLSNASGLPQITWNGLTATGTTSLLDGQWHDILGTVDIGVEVALWVDGIKVASTPGGSVPSGITSANTYLGYDGRDGSGVCDAVIDDVRLLNDPTPHPSSAETAMYWVGRPVVDQMEAEYGFDESSGDALNHARHAGRDLALTAYGERVTGKTGTALRTKSSNGPAASTVIDLPDMTRFSVMGWVKLQNVSGYTTLLSVWNEAGTWPRLRLYLSEDAGSYYAQMNHWRGDDDTTKITTVANLGTTLVADTWYHVAFVQAVGQVTIFLNGAIVYSGGSGSYTFSDWHTLYVGGDKGSTASPQYPVWDDVRVMSNYMLDMQARAYRDAAVVAEADSTALVGGQGVSLFHVGPYGASKLILDGDVLWSNDHPVIPLPDPIAAWKLNQATGGVVTDASGHGNALTLYNGTFSSQTDGYGGTSNVYRNDPTLKPADSLRTTGALSGLGSEFNQFTMMGWFRERQQTSGDERVMFGITASGINADPEIALWSNRPADPNKMTVSINTTSLQQFKDVLMEGDVWHHWTLTYNGSALVVYKDGVQLMTQAVTGTVTNAPFTIDAGNDGMVHDVRVFSQALTQPEVFAYMSKPV